MAPRRAALTGATGFLGRHLARAFADAGWRVRILSRRDPIHPLWSGFTPEVVAGGLGPAALEALCTDAEVVVHAAGLIKARTEAQFEAVNVGGARQAAAAAARAGARFLLVSSLAAREPQLSGYAASKRAGEATASEVLDGRLTVVRPPAVYGPSDRETLGLFKAAQASPLLPVLDPRARLALVHVEDAARQIVALADRPTIGQTFALTDDRPEGYGWGEIMGAASQVFGRSPGRVRIPALALRAAGAIGDLARLAGENPMLTSGKVREITHLDWGVAPHERAEGLPRSEFDLLMGFAQTTEWYRRAGWLAR